MMCIKNMACWCEACVLEREGFKDEMAHEPEDDDCKDYLEDIGVLEVKEG